MGQIVSEQETNPNKPTNKPKCNAMTLRLVLAALALSLLAACNQVAGAGTGAGRAATAETATLTGAGAACWASDRIPAMERMVYDERVLREAERDQTGRILREAVVERTPRRLVERAAEERLFAVPCPDQLTPDLIAALQRALMVRGHFDGSATGVLDTATRAAVRDFQRPQGLDSDILSLDAAWQLGLIAMPRAGL